MVDRGALDGFEVGDERRAVEGQYVQYLLGQKAVHVGKLQQSHKAGDEEVGNERKQACNLVCAVFGVKREVLLDGLVYDVPNLGKGLVAGEIQLDGGVCHFRAEALLHYERDLYAVAGIDASVADETVDTGIKRAGPYY